MIGKFKEWLEEAVSYELKGESGFIRKQVGKVFIFLHFFVGFFAFGLHIFS